MTHTDQDDPFPLAPLDLDAYDSVLLDQSNLDAFVDEIGGPTAVPRDFTVFTDDDHTRGTVEFNLIAFNEDDSYGIATQLHHPFSNADVVLDLRQDADPSFAEYIQGLL